MTQAQTIAYLRSVIEHVLIASEDGGTMNDIDWDLLREAWQATAELNAPRKSNPVCPIHL